MNSEKGYHIWHMHSLGYPLEHRQKDLTPRQRDFIASAYNKYVAGAESTSSKIDTNLKNKVQERRK